MLVLTRYVDERIMVGDDVIITVIDICGGKVKLGIEAPRGVRIDREEIRARIERDRRKEG